MSDLELKKNKTTIEAAMIWSAKLMGVSIRKAGGMLYNVYRRSPTSTSELRVGSIMYRTKKKRLYWKSSLSYSWKHESNPIEAVRDLVKHFKAERKRRREG